MNNIPRPEFPNPQFERENWMNLNGEWDFEFDFGNSGFEGGMLEKKEWNGKIIVPFCPESVLSGIGYTDFIPAVWYRRSFSLSAEQLKGRVFINFGAVDYEANVYINGKKAGYHKGGYTSFKFDITGLVNIGENEIIVNAVDDTRNSLVPCGKQSRSLKSAGCHYTRTTGIWQTVWLEFTPEKYIKSFKIFPDYENGTAAISAVLAGNGEFTAKAEYEGKTVACESKSASNNVFIVLELSEVHLWEVGCGRLYDLKLCFEGDEVSSYFGLRNVEMSGMKFLLNGKSVYQRLVLDQGFYPDGIYTASSDEALLNDIKLSLAVGFNGARLHEKVFEPRFLYHCDKMGYLAWGEFPNWGLDYSNPEATEVFIKEWIEELARDFNHPAIIGWCPFNETWDFAGRRQHDDVLRTVYRVTKLFDETRPCIDTSGNFHVETDIFDVHDYEQNPEIFAEHYEECKAGGKIFTYFKDRQEHNGEPAFVSEYGGIKWSLKTDDNAWGYGNAPKTGEEFIDRYKKLTDTLLDNPNMFAFCYTQLYDVEQEQNGLYTYERKAKFDPEIFKAINSRKAAIED